MKILEIPFEELVCDGPYFQTKTGGQKGCQVDFLIQTSYNCLYPCEIKYSKREVGSAVIKQVQEKIEVLNMSSKSFSIRPVLVHVNGVAPSVRKSGFFAKIINFSDFLV